MTNADNSDTDRDKDGADEANLGAMLRQAREQRNLSVVDLARCLRLEPRVIEYLENNQFDKLPAPAFIRGYVRSIAKEVDIDSAPLIAVFNLRIRDEPPSILDFESRPPVQITSDSNIIRYTTIALCIVMVMMVALWWQAHDIELPRFIDNFDSGAAGNGESDPATEPLPYSFELVVHPDDPFYRADAPPQAATASSENTGSNDDGQSADAASSTVRLVITTRNESWVEISDATGDKLFYALAKPGAVIEVRGKPPITGLIGNAMGVGLSYEGEAIDIKPFLEAGIARFELGRDGD